MAGTAIVAIHTREGFVLAADGRKSRGEKIVTEDDRKIFEVESSYHTLAYATAGIADIHQDEAGTEKVYDFGEVVDKAFKAQKHLTSVYQYFDRISKKLTKSIHEFEKTHGMEGSYPQSEDDTVAQLVAVGYYDKLSVVARVRICHNEQRVVLTPDIKVYPPKGTRWEMAIPRFVGECLVLGNDNRLAHRMTPVLDKFGNEEELSLSEAIDVATQLIQACDDPIARETEPMCSTVGGHLHLAVITLDDGFRWIVAPAS